MAKDWLKNIIDEGAFGRFSIIPAHYNYIQFGNDNDQSGELPQIWSDNGKTNLKWLKENKDKVDSVYKGLPKYTNQVAIFCGTSPILKKTWKYLKDIDDRFIIVATNSSAEFLLRRGITPDYIFMLDGRPGNWTMNLGKKAKKITAIFSAFCEPNALQEWQGKILIYPTKCSDKELSREVRKRYGIPLATGGNAFNTALACFALLTDIQIYLLVGNELSFKKKYYADRPSIYDEDKIWFFTKDINGKRVNTIIPLFTYKVWLENLIYQLVYERGYCFINCSEGTLGVDVDGSLLDYLYHMPLDEAIQKAKESLDFEAKPVEERNKEFYTLAYESKLYDPHNTENTWKVISESWITFNKALDVGCGSGYGIKAMRDKGYEVYGVDIADNRDKWEELSIHDYCRVAPAHELPYEDNEFDLIVCTEVMEHIPEEMVRRSLEEIYRVGSDMYAFTISLGLECNPIKNFLHTHITIKSADWWINMMTDIGYKFVQCRVDKGKSEYAPDTLVLIACKNIETFKKKYGEVDAKS